MSNYQVRPCRNTEDGVEETTEQKAEFWGLYKEYGAGLYFWVSDHKTKEEAQSAQKSLE